MAKKGGKKGGSDKKEKNVLTEEDRRKQMDQLQIQFKVKSKRSRLIGN